ncbi:MAG: hypothetical protein LC797_22125 [Chloroflexi bacterium]|nr:hypothetical protein [Chloroflexota bacterium]
MNIANHIDRATRHFPNQPAIIFDCASTTFAAVVGELGEGGSPHVLDARDTRLADSRANR